MSDSFKSEKSERRVKKRDRNERTSRRGNQSPTNTEDAALGVVQVGEDGAQKERNEKAHYVEAGGNPE